MVRGLQYHGTQDIIFSWIYGKDLVLQNIRGLTLFLLISIT